MVGLSRRSAFVVKQLVWGVAVMWLVLTVTWAVLNSLPETRAVGFETVEMGLAAYDDDPPGPLALYLDFMRSFVTFQWGESIYFGEPVTDLYAHRLPVTLLYTVPGVVVSVLVGTGVTTWAAIKPDGLTSRGLSMLSIVGLSVPAFILAQGVFFVMPDWLGWIRIYDPELALTARTNLVHMSVPAGIVALGFFAVQVRHARGETAEYLGEEFVKTARAKGAGRLRLAVHIFRNAWPTLASLVVGESLGLLLLMTIVIEEVFRIPGISRAVYYGFASGDPMVTFIAVFGVVLVGVGGTLARDFGRLLFDPRVQQ